jgi:hypothetical protein
MAHVFHYRSGDPVQAGDRATYFGDPGVVEFIASDGNPGYEWYVETFPPYGGIMLNVSSMGSVLISDVPGDEDLAFVSRGATATGNSE